MIHLKHPPKLKSNIGIYTAIVLMLYIFLCCSCKALQSTKGYEKYPKNTYWK